MTEEALESSALRFFPYFMHHMHSTVSEATFMVSDTRDNPTLNSLLVN